MRASVVRRRHTVGRGRQPADDEYVLQFILVHRHSLVPNSSSFRVSTGPCSLASIPQRRLTELVHNSGTHHPEFSSSSLYGKWVLAPSWPLFPSHVPITTIELDFIRSIPLLANPFMFDCAVRPLGACKAFALLMLALEVYGLGGCALGWGWGSGVA